MSSPEPRQSVSLREYAIVVAAAVLLYGASVAPGPLWQDSGLAQLRVLRHDLIGNLGLALAHPLYYVVAIAFQALPAGSPALKVNLVSAVFGALTVANAYLLLRLLTRRPTAAVVGTLSLALAHTFWQHCALAEVYTISTALLTAELLCLVQIARRSRPLSATAREGGARRPELAESHDPAPRESGGSRPRHATGSASLWLVLLFAANGLGVSNHLFALLAVPVWGVLLLRMLAGGRIGVKTLLACGGAWLLGASLYLGLIIATIARGMPVSEALHSALFGGRYAQNVLNLGFTPQLLVNSVLYLGLDFPTPVALLSFVGLVCVWKRAWQPLAACLTALVAVYLAWAVRYNVPDQYTFFIPAIVLIAVFIGLGADFLLSAVRFPRRWSLALILLALLPPAVYAPLPWIAERAGLDFGVSRKIPYRNAYQYFLWPWKTGYHGPLRFAHALREFPAGSHILADSTSARPVHYLMQLGRWNPGVTVWPPPEGGFEPVMPDRDEVAEPLAAGKLFVVSPAPGYCPDWILEAHELEDVGPAHRVLPRN